ncbi:hypothetical protein PO909_023746, partial [Leuciscus waleckii]
SVASILTRLPSRGLPSLTLGVDGAPVGVTTWKQFKEEGIMRKGGKYLEGYKTSAHICSALSSAHGLTLTGILLPRWERPETSEQERKGMRATTGWRSEKEEKGSRQRSRHALRDVGEGPLKRYFGSDTLVPYVSPLRSSLNSITVSLPLHLGVEYMCGGSTVQV